MSQLNVDAIRASNGTGDAISLTASNKTCTANITNNLSNRNLIINGAMQVAQRGTSSTSTGYQTVDRFKTGHTGLGVNVTQSQQSLSSSDSGPWEKGFRKYHRLALASAGTDSANNYLQIETCIEAQDIANSGWEYTSSSSYMTLSFWARASTAQNYGFAFHTQDGTGQLFPHTFALAANTWTKVTYSVPGNANVTFDDNNGPGLYLKIFPYLGSTYNGGTNNTWGAVTANGYGASIPTTWLTAGASTFDVTGVQLEVGNYATDFEHRSYADELLRSQRYYFKISPSAAQKPIVSTAWGPFQNKAQGTTFFPVEMRTEPTALEQSGTAGDYQVSHGSSGGDCNAVPVFNQASKFAATTTFERSGTPWSQGDAIQPSPKNSSGFLAWSAEL